ncbi:isoleucine--tRNA ligase 2 [Heyndrickxia sporothermodurans]|nr:isoleucine--tRNA ligase 2 [Heyndrickxia sporothermodurans]
MTGSEKAFDREQRVKDWWEKNKIFQQSIIKREGSEPFVFYEGPPTANGLPHAGHVLGRVIKDVVGRYKTMKGYQVIRKAGWDTHGLPVELGVEKQLGISGKKQIEEYGVEKFIEKCKESVFEYEREWRKFTEAIGYWVDMDQPYITLENRYIESVWHILSKIHQKKLLFKGHRVTPYCPSCQTSLSSHEVAQGYKDVKDLSATVKFKINGTENEYLLGWTTTPWTLPANVALAVHPDLTYVKVLKNTEIFIIAEGRLDTIMGNSYALLSKHKGKDLIGISYAPPFSYISVKKGHEVIGADFVTESSGTGIVHLAPAYGEVDYEVIRKNQFDFINVVDRSGCYTEKIAPLSGRFVKDCNVDIIKMLSSEGLLFQKEKYQHSYPHCWRCDTPLLYYAMEGWFIRTTAIKERIKQNNDSVQWFPEHIKNGRFGNFLENMVDWNLGRNRYWGTPLNIWECNSCDEQYAPESLRDLKEKAVDVIADNIELHKPYVDRITLKCPTCGGHMTRTSEVIDVWFDSGSMPFAQYHYPFENHDLFKKQFPADIVIEGIDQTRGWFYSLLAVSSLFTGQSPYKRVLTHGHILDENGRKMSKSKGNVIDPVKLVKEYGADAFRWALIADSAPWNNKKFSHKVVSQAKSKLIDTIANVYSFYTLYAEIDNYVPSNDKADVLSLIDRWILSRLNSVIKKVNDALDQYDFTIAARELVHFVNDLSNWYIRRSRHRFWREEMNADKFSAYQTLYEVLVKVSQLLAPFTPFISEDIYFHLTGESVHLSDFPQAEIDMIDVALEEEMEAILQVVELARSVRTSVGIRTRQPLSVMYIFSNQEKDIQFLTKYFDILKAEINVKEINTHTKIDEVMNYALKLKFETAGRKLGKNSIPVHNYLRGLSDSEAKKVLKDGCVEVNLSSNDNVQLDLSDIIIEQYTEKDLELLSNLQYTIILNTNISNELKMEGLARELIRSVQNYRKELKLPVEKRVNIIFNGDDNIKEVVQSYEELLQTNLLVQTIQFGHHQEMKYVMLENEQVGIYVKAVD